MQVPAGATVWFEQLSATMVKSAAFVPVTVTAPAPNTRSALPVFVMVSVWTTEVEPVLVFGIDGVDALSTGAV